MSLDITKLIFELTQAEGVSGFEGAAARLACERLAPYCDSAEVYQTGTVLGYRACGRENAPKLLLDAHIDQIGFMVSEVLEGGMLRVLPIGGVDPRMLLASEVRILADKPMMGVFACLPPHLQTAADYKKSVPVDEMVIDTGFSEEYVREHVKPGTPVALVGAPVKLKNGSITSRSIDDRAGFAAILYALDLLKDDKLLCDLIVMGSAGEETSFRGAITGAYHTAPDYCVAVDVSHAKTPGAPADKTFEYGGGAMIGMGPNLDRAMAKRMAELARAKEIKYQIEVMEGHTGTNCWPIQVSREGVACALLSIPLRYMHTPIETIKVSDAEAVGKLLAEFIRTFDGGAVCC